MNFREVGIICLNQHIQEECQDCLWWEWDTANRRCRNFQSPICNLKETRALRAHPVSRPLPFTSRDG